MTTKDNKLTLFQKERIEMPQDVEMKVAVSLNFDHEGFSDALDEFNKQSDAMEKINESSEVHNSHQTAGRWGNALCALLVALRAGNTKRIPVPTEDSND